MPYRLEDLPQLTFPESLLVLRESTRAYEFIFPKSGPFHVTDQMIGLNQDGHIKSWINPDWSKNYPVTEVPTLLTSRETSDSKIYNLIDP